MKKAVSGYVIGADLTHTMTYLNCRIIVRKVNLERVKYLEYGWILRQRKLRYEETAQYLMPDNSFII